MSDPLIGLTLSHYRIVSRLGAGGMGVVYRAEDVRLHRHVALKLLTPGHAADPINVERLFREACAASALSHPNICVVHDVGTDQGRSFIVMELLQGQTLKEKMGQLPMPVGEAVDVAMQIADALQTAHIRSIIHRDIKPANIFITSRGQAKLVDFGLAKNLAPPTEADQTFHDLTHSGATVGTVAYMSTEQVRGETLDGRTDLFSLGVVLYEMLTGTQAFAANATAMVFDAILHRPVGRPSALNPSVPRSLDRVVARAVEKERKRRYLSAADLHAALQKVRQELQTGAAASGSVAGSEPATRRVSPKKTDSGKSRAIQSLAVLPFVNVSADADSEYLSDGITESIINKLSQVGGLRVVPCSTVFRYKGRDDLKTIGSELKVRALVSGRLSHRGQTLVVNAELVDAKKESQLWGEQYNRTISDIFEVQEQMAVEITKSLQLKLSGDDQKRLVKRETEDPVAYRAYLKGRFHWNKRSVQGFLQAIEHFQEAIESDPHYALAYAGIADTYNVLGYYNIRRPVDAYPRAKAAAARALAIDESLAEAHASMGYARLFFDRDWPGAEEAFLEAIRLKPAYASAHQWYGWYLFARRRLTDAVGAFQRAHDLDPLSLIINDHFGYALALAGRHEEALQQLRATIEIDRSFALTHLRLGSLYLTLGRCREAIEEIETAARLSDGRLGLGYLGHAYATCGEIVKAGDVLTRLQNPLAERFVSPIDLALVHAGLGELSATFALLTQAVKERISDVVRIHLLPWPRPVLEDPRFAGVLGQVGIPPES